MNRLLLFLPALGLCAQPATASDFSELARPEFARSLLLSPEQRDDIACARRWFGTSKRPTYAPLIDEIEERASVALGARIFAKERARPDDEEVTEIALGPPAPDDPEFDAAAEAEAEPEALPDRCFALATAFDKGGMAAAAPLLAPRPVGLIPLPPTGQCLKQLEMGLLAKENPTLVRSVRELRKELAKTKRIGAEEKAAIERDYAAFTPRGPLDPDRPADLGPEMDVQDIVCFPAMAELAARLAGRQ